MGFVLIAPFAKPKQLTLLTLLTLITGFELTTILLVMLLNKQLEPVNETSNS